MSESASQPRPPRQNPVLAAFRSLASPRLTAMLLLILAAVLAAGTVVESRSGAEHAHWYVYQSSWFCWLLGLLAANLGCAVAIRFPWQRHETGFVMAHAGLLILLAGALLTYTGGVQGRISLVEGERTSDLLLPARSQVTATWAERPGEAPYEFTFEGGPVAWPEGQTFEVGEVDGIGVRILKYYPRAKAVEEWVADESPDGRPVVHFELLGPDGKSVARHWLADEQFGDEVFVGPLLLRLQRAANDHMLEEFLEPPTRDEETLGPQGTLSVYYQDAVERIAVAEGVGQKTSVGETGVSVEIAEYLPNAQPDKLGKFSSHGEEPKNPMVELRVHLPGHDEPLRQIAFAANPLLNLDGVYATACPVRFVYHHPQVAPRSSFQMLQTSDGLLHAREFAGGEYKSHGVVASADRLELKGGFQLVVQEFLAHARRKVTFERVTESESPGGQAPVQPAAFVEMRVAGIKRQVWLQRDHVEFGRAKFKTPDGPLQLQFGYGRMPLGCTVKLVEVRPDASSGGGEATVASKLQVVYENEQSGDEREVSPTEPLVAGRYTLRQAGYSEAGHGRREARFHVAHDPGRSLKYLGSLMILVGMATMFYLRDRLLKQERSGSVQRQQADDEQPADANASRVPPPKLPAVTTRAVVMSNVIASSRETDE